MNANAPKPQPAGLFAYTIACTFETRTVSEEWIEWLRKEHLAQVLAAGALDAELIRFDSDERSSIVCEVRYHFRSREAFKAYECEHAPHLRAEGLARFPASRGITYHRTLGEVRAQQRS
ncbi:MAG: DUF4286 family protein [Phycisphaerales bacterium]|nr:DUF4286 family protein [Phycisphaerales bacterium]